MKATIALAEATEKISKVKGKMDEKPKMGHSKKNPTPPMEGQIPTP